MKNAGERKAGLKGSVCFLFHCLLWGTWEPNQGQQEVSERGEVSVLGISYSSIQGLQDEAADPRVPR